jgi:hypothetical protein
MFIARTFLFEIEVNDELPAKVAGQGVDPLPGRHSNVDLTYARQCTLAR